MLKSGDKVVMNGKYYVSEENKGREFVVKAGPQEICGTACVWLDGYSGCYAADGLTAKMKPYTREELGDYLCENIAKTQNTENVHLPQHLTALVCVRGAGVMKTMKHTWTLWSTAGMIT